MWSQLEPTPAHLTYLIFSLFLIAYALFSVLIRDRLHLAEPPLALVTGILLGPAALHVLSPHDRWGLTDDFTLELTRVVLSLQCLAVGVELPARWLAARRHQLSVACLLGPGMLLAWTATALIAWRVLGLPPATCLILAACLSPTDPVLAASVVGGASRFSRRVPARLRHLLSAESACNDGASFPLLYLGLAAFSARGGPAVAARDWFLVTVLYQCVLGLVIGAALGLAANRLLRFSEARGWASHPSLVVFYLLLAVLCAGLGSTLGSDDFLIAFGAGVGFAHDGWFSAKAEEVEGPAAPFRSIVDLVLTSGVFVYFGASIPFADFSPDTVTGTGAGGGSSSSSPPADVLRGHVSPGRLVAFLVLVLLLRRIPALLLLRAARLLPDVKSYTEALFAGHFGPMGVGALFLAIEARAQLETGTSVPLPRPDPPGEPPYDERAVAIAVLWPVVCFVVMGSTLVHGLSVLVISLWSHFTKKRRSGERMPLLGQDSDGLAGMVHDGEDEESGEDDDHGGR